MLEEKIKQRFLDDIMINIILDKQDKDLVQKENSELEQQIYQEMVTVNDPGIEG